MSRTIVLVIVCTFLADAVRLNQKIFADVKSIEFLDPQMNGVLFVLNDRFVKNYLQDNQFPTLYLTVLGLDAKTRRTTKILYPELTENGGKDVKIDNLQQSTWYIGCLEFESITRQNETVGCECRLFRTLDKFGNNQASIVKNADLLSSEDQSLKFRIKFDFDHPKVQLTTFLSPISEKTSNFLIESKIFIISNDTKFITVTFDALEPKTDYGHLCIIERPLTVHALYTAMGRLVDLSSENCFLENQLITKDKKSIIYKKDLLLINTDNHRSYDVAAQRYIRNPNSAMYNFANGLLLFTVITLLMVFRE